MPLNAPGFVAGIVLAQNMGVQPDQVMRVALPAAVMPNTALGVAVADVLAQREAASEQQAAATATATAVGAAGIAPAVAVRPIVTATAASSSDPLPQPWSLPVVTVAPPPPPGYEAGQILQADPGRWRGVGTDAEPNFQWYRDDNEIRGATSAQYTVEASDEGHTLRVEVIYGDPKEAHVSTISGEIAIPERELGSETTKTSAES